VTRVSFPGATFSVNNEQIGDLFAVVPDVLANNLRDVFGQFGGSHRREVGNRLRGKPLRKMVQAVGKFRNPSFFYRAEPKQTGKTANEGFQFASGPRLSDISLDIFSTSEVTALHETGGTVRPKSGPWLVIPIKSSGGNVATTKSGGIRFDRGRTVDGKRKRSTVQQWKDNGFAVFRRGQVLFAAKRLKSGKLSNRPRPIAILKRSVTIPARLGVISTWESLEGDRQRRLGTALQRTLFAAKRVNDRRFGRQRVVA